MISSVNADNINAGTYGVALARTAIAGVVDSSLTAGDRRSRRDAPSYDGSRRGDAICCAQLRALGALRKVRF